MSNKEPAYHALTHYFEAPDEFRGEFGWLCGYSADAEFLDAAAERFTRDIKSQRRQAGIIALAVMLDPGNPQIKPAEVPGILHLPYREPDSGRSFRLLHAKIALLTFRHQKESERRLMRLIVSTGNWTRQTLEETLDLVWCGEIDAQQLESLDDAGKQSCSDIWAAWSFLSAIRPWFDFGMLQMHSLRGETKTTHSIKHFDEFAAQIGRKARGTPARFFDNRDYGLLAQLPALVANTGNTARNCLCMASGFYESPGKTQTGLLPMVLKAILNTLQSGIQGAKLLTRDPFVDVFVNPQGCQSVAANLSALVKEGWCVRPPTDPVLVDAKDRWRSLHAKFIFSAFYREDTDSYSSGWLYLGSGNLTNPGFKEKASKDAGNLEAGIVLSVERLDDNELRQRLPLQWDDEFESEDDLNEGKEMEERPAEFLAAPVAFFHYGRDESCCWLIPTPISSNPFEVIRPDGSTCPMDTENRIRWQDAEPLSVTVRWFNGSHHHQIDVPVVDAYGRVCASPLGPITIAEAGWQLADFPSIPEDDSQDNETANGEGWFAPTKGTGHADAASTYPIRMVMQLVEQIATRQTGICLDDWPAWCNRLEQILVQAKDSSELIDCRKLEVNVLSPLWHSPFRPAYAESANSEMGKEYEEVLGRVEAAWGISGLQRLGDKCNA